MSRSIDELPNDVESLKALLLAAYAASLAAEAKVAALAAEADWLAARAERLDHIVSVLRRAQFGRRSERIGDEQIELALEDVETQHGAEDAAAEKTNTLVKAKGTKARRANRGHLPAHLPREEIVIEPETQACPCCGGALHVMGEDVSERLDKIPARLRVIVTRRPKYACRSCTDGVLQAPPPNRLIEGGLPTEALVADVLIAKYADHLPLYRPALILAREGVELDRSTLAHWVGFAAFELAPLHERLVAILNVSTKLVADETRCPVLDPGRGKTKTDYQWAVARDDRPWGGSDPPAVAYAYAPGRGAEHAAKVLAGSRVAAPSASSRSCANACSAACRSVGFMPRSLASSRTRSSCRVAVVSGSGCLGASCVLRVNGISDPMMGLLGDGGAVRRGETRFESDQQLMQDRKGRQRDLRRTNPKAGAIGPIKLPRRHNRHETRRQLDMHELARRAPLPLDAACAPPIEWVPATVNHDILPDMGRMAVQLALSRKNALFAGSDEGGANWAIIASLIQTAKLKGVNPHAWLADTLTKLVNR